MTSIPSASDGLTPDAEPPPIPPRVRREMERILDGVARRWFEEELTLVEKEGHGELTSGEREYLDLIRKDRDSTLSEVEYKRFSDYRSHRIEP